MSKARGHPREQGAAKERSSRRRARVAADAKRLVALGKHMEAARRRAIERGRRRDEGGTCTVRRPRSERGRADASETPARAGPVRQAVWSPRRERRPQTAVRSRGLPRLRRRAGLRAAARAAVLGDARQLHRSLQHRCAGPRPAHRRRRADVVRAGGIRRHRRVHDGDPLHAVRAVAVAEPCDRPSRSQRCWRCSSASSRCA